MLRGIVFGRSIYLCLLFITLAPVNVFDSECRIGGKGTLQGKDNHAFPFRGHRVSSSVPQKPKSSNWSSFIRYTARSSFPETTACCHRYIGSTDHDVVSRAQVDRTQAQSVLQSKTQNRYWRAAQMKTEAQPGPQFCHPVPSSCTKTPAIGLPESQHNSFREPRQCTRVDRISDLTADWADLR